MFDIAQVEYAILEQNGQLTIFLKEENQPLTIGDVDKSVLSKRVGDEMSHAIIVDGKINESNLRLVSKSKDWVENQLRKKKVKLKSVFLMTINNKEEINLIMKEK